jgi:DinB family protein
MVMTDERGRLVEPLREVPRRIAAATNGVDEVRLTLRTADEPWSVNDVLAHLRSVADHRMRYMRRMATGKHATLAYVSPRSELKITDYLDRTFAENLAGFTAARTEFLAWLESLPGEAWEHGAIIRGRPETVATYARYLGEHELVHCDQIEALLR